MIDKIDVVRWFVTPKMLREIADSMEKEWPNRFVGDSVYFKSFGFNPRIELLFDQEAIKNE